MKTAKIRLSIYVNAIPLEFNQAETCKFVKISFTFREQKKMLVRKNYKEKSLEQLFLTYFVMIKIVY